MGKFQGVAFFAGVAAYISSGGGRVAWTQGTVPEFFERGLETKEGMIGPAAVLLGVVTDASPFGLAVDRENGGVDVEDQSMPEPGQGEQMNPEAVVKPGQLPNRLGRQPFEEPPQRHLVWELLESQHFQECAVVLEDIRLVDAAKAHDDAEHQSQEKFRRVVDVPLGRSREMPLQQTTQSELLAKTLDQPHPAEVGEMGPIEGKSEIPGSFWPVTQNTPWVCFLSQAFLGSHYESTHKKGGRTSDIAPLTVTRAEPPPSRMASV